MDDVTKTSLLSTTRELNPIDDVKTSPWSAAVAAAVKRYISVEDIKVVSDIMANELKSRAESRILWLKKKKDNDKSDTFGAVIHALNLQYPKVAATPEGWELLCDLARTAMRAVPYNLEPAVAALQWWNDQMLCGAGMKIETDPVTGALKYADYGPPEVTED
jgi:hypothetical protein